MYLTKYLLLSSLLCLLSFGKVFSLQADSTFVYTVEVTEGYDSLSLEGCVSDIIIGRPGESMTTESIPGFCDFSAQMGDSQVTGEVPIGFEFSFFNETYTSFYIASSGFITFQGLEGPCCGKPALPDPLSPNNLIAFGWLERVNGYADSDIRYKVKGEAPNRVGVMEVRRTFSGYEEDEVYTTLQVHLYEGSNDIVVTVATMPKEEGSHLIGIENRQGSLSFTPGSTGGSYDTSIVNKTFRFRPEPLPFDIGIDIPGEDTVGCPGSRSIDIALNSFGRDPVEDLVIGWQINGTEQPEAIYNPPSGKATLHLGTIEVKEQETKTIKAWIKSVKGGRDQYPYNDTTEVSYKAGMSGTYSIGRAGADFIRIQEALDGLMEYGMCGAVTFNIVEGTYNEQLTLSKIPKTEDTLPLLIQSAKKDTASVDIYANGTTLSLSGVSRLRLQHLTLRSTATDGIVIRSDGLSSHNTFRKNQIKAGPSSSYSPYRGSAVYCQGSNHTFRDNDVKNGSFGIALESSYGITASGNQVMGNVLEGQYRSGIYVERQANVAIINNTVSSSGYYSYYKGINITSSGQALRVRANRIKSLYGYGLYLSHCSSDASNPGLVSNNFIALHGGGSNSASGIYSYEVSHVNFYHNNVHLYSTGQGKAFHTHKGSHIKVMNNNLVNSGDGYAYYVEGTGAIEQTDYNNLYTKGDKLGYWRGNVTDLLEWRQRTQGEAHSLSTDPFYTSDTDLHVAKALLDSAGTYLSEVPFDIDGETRGTVPDIGADEFVPSGMDIAAVAVVPPKAPFPAGNQPISLIIQNAGTESITSLRLSWELKGKEQETISWTGNLRGKEMDTVLLFNHDFEERIPLEMKTWVTRGDNTPDTNAGNDTLNITGIYSAIAGAYSLGPDRNDDFQDLATLAEVLNQGGVLSPVTVNIAPGNYRERILLKEIPGASETSPVLIQSSNARPEDVVISASQNGSKNYIIGLEGTDYLTLRYLTLRYFSGSGVLLSLENGADHVQVLDNHLLGRKSDHYYGGNYNHALIRAQNEYRGNDHSHFERNIISGGAYGMFLRGNTYSSRATGLVIKDNTFKDQHNEAIELINQDTLRISGNTLTKENDSKYNAAIRINNSNGPNRIVNNKITVKNGGGIYLSNVTGTSDKKSLVANNFIAITNSSPYDYGFFFDQVSHQDCFYNSVSISSESTEAKGVGFYARGAAASLTLKNNNLANNAGGLAIQSADNSILASDYNNLYTTGGSVAYFGKYLSTLEDWKNATGLDDHSVSTDPEYTSNTDLHTSAVNLDGKGTPLTEVTKDIDGDQRSSTAPDIGADEFNHRLNDAGVSAILFPELICGLDTSHALEVEVANYGGRPTPDFEVAYVFGPDTVRQLIGAGAISPGQRANITFDTLIRLDTYGTKELLVFTSLQNDDALENDTLKTSFKVAGPISAPVSNMLPADQGAVATKRVSFSWVPPALAEKYDLYLWPENEDRPSTPLIADWDQIKYQNPGQLLFGATYRWQVIAKNGCDEVESPVQSFSIRDLPDLTLTQVDVPASAFSGQSLTVDWIVKNEGSGSTGESRWFDYAYLSSDTLLDPSGGSDIYLGGVPNFSALEAGRDYAQSSTFDLPEGIEGKYYIFISTDKDGSLLEIDEENNDHVSNPIGITLTPPPNLQVIGINRPNNSFSGQEISIGWTVKNTGEGGSRSKTWQDNVYLSKDSVLNSGDTRIGQVQHIGVLDKDSTYTGAMTYIIPAQLFGTYHVIVKTDSHDDVFEYVFENDNLSVSEKINIVLLPPPDYQVTAVSAPEEVANQDTLQVKWQVSNLGGSATGASYWRDAVYLADPAQKDLSKAVLLAKSRRIGNRINPGESYEDSLTVHIPRTLKEGRYHWIVQTDADEQVYEFDNEQNNWGVMDSSVQVFSPNLRIMGLQMSGQRGSGERLTVTWENQNTGTAAVYDTLWTDSIYLSPVPRFNPKTAIALGGEHHMKIVAPGGSFTSQHTVQLPHGISGTYYLIVITDKDNHVFENDETDNMAVTAALPISLSPSPDFIVAGLQSEGDTLQAGGRHRIRYRVANQGTGVPKGGWKDKIYISKTAEWSPRARPIGGQFVQKEVATGASYTQNPHFVIPPDLAAGAYYLHVYADGDDEVYEHKREHNNIASYPVWVKAYPPIDLEVSGVVFTGTPASGREARLSYTVSNEGQGSTFVKHWEDAVYLSSDKVLSDDDKLLNHKEHEGSLAPNATYQYQIDFQVPEGIQGKYHFLAVADHRQVHMDVDLTNNHAAAADGNNGNGGDGIDIELTEPSDLVITALDLPVQAFSGQPFEVAWTVTNQGSGITTAGRWSDKVFLSTDEVLDKDDLLLHTKVRDSALGAGDAYTVTTHIMTSLHHEGNYILLFDTDHNDAQYEHGAEDNNLKTATITLTRAVPVDLQVTDIVLPEMTIVGEAADLSWNTKNVGENPVRALMTEALFLSKDTLWDIHDILIGKYQNRLDLAPGQGKTSRITALLPGVPLGDYHVLVKTDILDNVYETDNDNNTGHSLTYLNIAVPELVIGTTVLKKLPDGQSRYYKIIVPDHLKGESLQLTLLGDTVNGHNELYLRYQEVPTRVEYDFKHENPFSGKQEITVPELKAGIYYVMLSGSTGKGEVQEIHLTPKILNFEIKSIRSSTGGDRGRVTVLLRGAKFDEGMRIRLGSGQRSITADSLIYVDPTRVFVRFDLTRQPLGFYDVMATNQKNEAFVLQKAFEVIEAGTPDLVTNIIQPRSTRPGWKLEYKVQFLNNGTTDLILPEIRFVSDGAPIALSREKVALGEKELRLRLEEFQGPKGILRPGAGGTITVYTEATEALNFILHLPKNK